MSCADTPWLPTPTSPDDCWAERRDPKSGRIIPVASRFPSGMKVSYTGSQVLIPQPERCVAHR